MRRAFCIFCVLLLLLTASLPVFAAESDMQAAPLSSDGGGLFSWVGDAAGFIKRIFVPEPDYFHDQLADLSQHVNDRFGGLAYLYHMLDSFFTNLKYAPSVGLTFSLPKDFFFRGYTGFSMDMLTAAKPYLNLARLVFTGAFCIWTAIVCYHKLRLFFNESE